MSWLNKQVNLIDFVVGLDLISKYLYAFVDETCINTIWCYGCTLIIVGVRQDSNSRGGGGRTERRPVKWSLYMVYLGAQFLVNRIGLR